MQNLISALEVLACSSVLIYSSISIYKDHFQIHTKFYITVRQNEDKNLKPTAEVRWQ